MTAWKYLTLHSSMAKFLCKGQNWTPKDLERTKSDMEFPLCDLCGRCWYNIEFLHRFFVDLDFMSLKPLNALLKSSPTRLHDSKLLASMHIRSPTPCDSDILAMTFHICFVQSPLLQSNPKLRSRCQASIEIRCTCTLGLKSGGRKTNCCERRSSKIWGSEFPIHLTLSNCKYIWNYCCEWGQNTSMYLLSSRPM